MGLFKNLKGTTLDLFRIGRGTAGNKSLIANNADSTKPELRFNDTQKTWEQSDDGVHFEGIASKTTDVLHVYADGTSGSDSNDGLTIGTPKKTLPAVFALVPNIIEHNTCIHLSGTFSDSSDAVIIARTITNANAVCIIDGGSDLTEIVAAQTADGDSTVNYIEVTGAGWSVNAYAGYWVEMPSGSGTLYGIQENTAERIYPVKEFAISPASQDFRIVRPSTTLTKSFRLSGCNGYGAFHIQRLYSTDFVSAYNCAAGISLNALISNYTSSYAAVWGRFCRGFTSAGWGGPISTTDFVTVLNNIGLSCLDGGFSAEVCDSAYFANGFCPKATFENCGFGNLVYAITRGACVKQALINNCRSNGQNLWTTYADVGSSTGYNPTKIKGSSGVGLTINGSQLSIGDADISNNASHGIEISNSRVYFNGVTTGTGNSGAGLYAHSGSQVTIKSGSPPTLTGTVGDIACSNPDFEDATWSLIDNGSALQIAAEQTLIKEVP